MKGAASLAELAIFGAGLRLPMGLVIDELELKGSGIRGDFDAKTLGSQGPVEAEIRIGAESLAAFLRTKVPGQVSIGSVRYLNNLVVVEASVNMIINISAVATAAIVIKSGSELWVELAEFDGPGPARGMIEGQLGGINPIVSASDLPISLRFTKVWTSELFLHVAAEGELPPSWA